MSKDQLGWLQILSTAANSDDVESEIKNKVDATSGAPSTAPSSAREANGPIEDSSTANSATISAGPSAKPPKAPRARKKKLTEDTSAPKKYSQKNWGRLEFPAASGVSAQQGEKQSAAPASNATAELEESRSTTSSNRVEERKIAPPDFADDVQEVENEGPQVISVSELNRHIREILEGRFPLLWLKGEISNFKAHTSGHFYFSLKDAKAQINAVMFRGFNSQLKFRPEDGMEVVVRGKVTVYEPRGNYQIFCELMDPVGAGALQKAYEQLKAKLQKEGLFDAARKRPLPELPRHIVIVTSPTGAAIRDMLNVLGRRYKGAKISLVPCKVQGDQAPREIVAAIQLANRLSDVDVMIVGRGGGSIEDLWAFNDEGVARAIAASRVPVISAVGHEVDFTIADFVADLRAPTPSAAAELVVKNAADLKSRIEGLQKSMVISMDHQLRNLNQAVANLSRRLIDPQRRIQDAAIRCDELLQRLHVDINRLIEQRRLKLKPLESELRSLVKRDLLSKRKKLELKMAVLDSISPLKVFERGFSVVMRAGNIVSDVDQLKSGDSVNVKLAKGEFVAEVKTIQHIQSGSKEIKK
jgi:exodeoxyribonuclease VII large subunit